MTETIEITNTTSQPIDYTDILTEINDNINSINDNINSLSNKLTSEEQFIQQCAMNLYINYLPMKENMSSNKSDKEIAKGCVKSAKILAQYLF